MHSKHIKIIKVVHIYVSTSDTKQPGTVPT